MNDEKPSTSQKERRPMKTFARIVSAATMTLSLGGIVTPAYAQQPWSTMPAACASTDNNFYDGVPNADYPAARFRVPGGAFAFNGFHDGYIAIVCNVDNPRDSSATPRWNQLQVTYRDPDGLQKLGGYGTEYQAYVELVRVSKTNGAWSRIAVFDSNLICAGTSTSCAGDNTVKSIAVPFTHTFDFVNYTYAVYGRLYRALAIWGLSPALYQLRLQPTPVVPPVLDPGFTLNSPTETERP
jgi:hypothetical protein